MTKRRPPRRRSTRSWRAVRTRFSHAGGVPDYFSAWGPSVGLGAAVRMLRPVRAGERASVEWTVSKVRAVPKLKGWVMDIQGKLVRADDVTAMTAETEVLFWEPN